MKGSKVNIEVDIIGKYVEKLLSAESTGPDLDGPGDQSGIFVSAWFYLKSAINLIR